MAQQLYTHPDSNGTYELLGTMKPKASMDIPIEFKYLGYSKGAGKSKLESLKVYQDKGVYLYEVDIAVWGIDHGPRVIYRDVETKVIYHRVKSDFDNRMSAITQ